MCFQGISALQKQSHIFMTMLYTHLSALESEKVDINFDVVCVNVHMCACVCFIKIKSLSEPENVCLSEKNP